MRHVVFLVAIMCYIDIRIIFAFMSKHPITYYASQEILSVMTVSDDNALAVAVALEKFGQEMSVAPGSKNNHQTWVGGYVDHIRDTMVIATELYNVLSLHGPLPFTLSEVHEVLFIHDIEKPLIYENKIRDVSSDMRKIMVQEILSECNFVLSDKMNNALKYIHGENEDYTGEKRVMNELAAFCHMCDVASSRIFHSYGKGPRIIPDGDNSDVDTVQPKGSMDIYTDSGKKVFFTNKSAQIMCDRELKSSGAFTVENTVPGKNKSTVVLKEIPGVNISTKLLQNHG